MFSIFYSLLNSEISRHLLFICKNANTLSYYPTYMLPLCSKVPYNDNIQNCDSILFILMYDTRVYLNQFIIYSKYCEWYRAGKNLLRLIPARPNKKIRGERVNSRLTCKISDHQLDLPTSGNVSSESGQSSILRPNYA